MTNSVKRFGKSASISEVLSDHRNATWQGASHFLHTSVPITGSPRSVAKAMRGFCVLLNANDDAIDDLFNMIERWEELTGRPFFTSQYLLTETMAELKGKPTSRLTTSQARKFSDVPIDDAVLAKQAEAIIKERQMQFRDMPADLKSERFVRILLVLLIETLCEREVRLTSIGYAIDRPQTSVLRYLQQLGKHDLVTRSELASDGRVTLIKLTERGDKLARVLASRAIGPITKS